MLEIPDEENISIDEKYVMDNATPETKEYWKEVLEVAQRNDAGKITVAEFIAGIDKIFLEVMWY